MTLVTHVIRGDVVRKPQKPHGLAMRLLLYNPNAMTFMMIQPGDVEADDEIILNTIINKIDVKSPDLESIYRLLQCVVKYCQHIGCWTPFTIQDLVDFLDWKNPEQLQTGAELLADGELLTRGHREGEDVTIYVIPQAMIEIFYKHWYVIDE